MADVGATETGNTAGSNDNIRGLDNQERGRTESSTGIITGSLSEKEQVIRSLSETVHTLTTLLATKDKIDKTINVLTNELQRYIESTERRTQYLLTLVGQLDQTDAQLATIESELKAMQASSQEAQKSLELATSH